jgi:hypothetical protein
VATEKTRLYIRESVNTSWVRHLGPLAIAAVLSVVPAVSPAPASATPTVGVSAVVLSKQTVDGKDYIVSDITIAPGGSTGWHTHRDEISGSSRRGH